MNMICPKCHQPTTDASNACCPVCGFAGEPYRRRLQSLYLLTFAFFASVLFYGIVVYGLAREGKWTGLAAPPELGYLIVAIGGLLSIIVAPRFGAPPAQIESMAQLQSLHIIRLALVEAAASLGIGAFLLTGQIVFFVLLLGASALGYGIVGAQLPALQQRLAELAVAEGDSAAECED